MLRPKLRRVDLFQAQRAGERIVILRDPLAVSESCAVAAEFEPLLRGMDGTKTPAQLRQSLRMRGVLDLEASALDAFLSQLRADGWLDDDIFAVRWRETLAQFLDEDPRRPRFAGVLYPSEPHRVLDELHVPPLAVQLPPTNAVQGIVLPHCELSMLAPMYNALVAGLPAAGAVDCLVVLGTDHGRGLTPLTLAHRDFQTPMGTCVVDRPSVEALGRQLPWMLREEIRHRDAHSIELALVLARAHWREAMPTIIPVLCGSSALRSGEQTQVEAGVAALREQLRGRRWIVWASAELTHAGVAYGGDSLTPQDERALAARDRACIGAFSTGAGNLLRVAQSEHAQRWPSGIAALSVLRRLLPQAQVGAQLYELQRFESGGLIGAAGRLGMLLHDS